MSRESSVGCSFPSFFYTVFGLLTAMIGYQIHNSFFWSIVDFIFSPLAWFKWIILHEVSMTIIKHAFWWFFQ